MSGGSTDLLAQPLSSCRLGHRETVHFGDGSRSRQALRPVLLSQGNPIIPTRAESRHENIVRKQNLLPATTFDQPSRRQELCSETVQDPRLIKIATTHLHTNNHNAVLPIHLCFSKRLSSVNAGLESRQLGASGATTRARESENIVSGVFAPVLAKLRNEITGFVLPPLPQNIFERESRRTRSSHSHIPATMFPESFIALISNWIRHRLD